MTVRRATPGREPRRQAGHQGARPPRPAAAGSAGRRPGGVPRDAAAPANGTSGQRSFAALNRRLNDAMDAHPILDYTMIRTVVLVLAGLGIVMVMSSSMAASFAASASVWSATIKQTSMVALGLLAFWAMLKTSPERMRGWANVLMCLAVALLILVLIPGIGTGKEEVGSQSWIALGPLRLQPSELARVAIAVWGAKILANRDHLRPSKLDNGFVPFLGVAGLCLVLIAAQGDFGMAVSFAIVVALILIFAGIPWSLVGIVGGLVGVSLVVVFLSGGYRSNRFHVYFDALFGRFNDTRGIAFQSHQGFLSLADGSLFGVGLGQSRAKWFYLPEARNDFIFAVIGEELGLWGGALVIILFALIGFFGMRVARRAQNQFQALMAASLAAGVVSQAFINIGYVIGLLPVTGIQLPMLSAGGTSAVITLGSMGILASVARHEPDAVSSMQNYGRPMFDRILAIGEPTSPGQARPRRGRGAPGVSASRTTPAEREARFGTPITARSTAASRRPADAPARTAVPRRDVRVRSGQPATRPSGRSGQQSRRNIRRAG